MLAEKIQSRGFHLEVVGQNLVVKPAGKLTDQQRQFIRQYKAEILRELINPDPKNDSEAKGREIITQLAADFGWPADDLLDWYKDDLQDFSELPIQRLRWIVMDYLTRYHQWKPDDRP